MSRKRQSFNTKSAQRKEAEYQARIKRTSELRSAETKENRLNMLRRIGLISLALLGVIIFIVRNFIM